MKRRTDEELRHVQDARVRQNSSDQPVCLHFPFGSMASLLVVLTPPLVLGAVCIALLGISRSVKQRPSLQHYEHTHAFSHDCWRQAQPETSVTLSRSSMATTPSTSAEAILQFVLDALHHLTGLPLLMVNQPEHNLPCLTRTSAIETQMRADQKNAELLDSPTRIKERSASSTWSDCEAPEEEMSDLSSDEEEIYKVAEVASVSSAQNQLFDGLEFYLAVTQVRERTVRSVLALGMAKTMTTLRERQQNESIAVIQQQYPDFTCLPTKSTAARQQPPMDLLTALRLPTATAVAQSQSPMKRPVRAHIAGDDEGRVRHPSLPSHGPNISRVA